MGYPVTWILFFDFLKAFAYIERNSKPIQKCHQSSAPLVIRNHLLKGTMHMITRGANCFDLLSLYLQSNVTWPFIVSVDVTWCFQFLNWIEILHNIRNTLHVFNLKFLVISKKNLNGWCQMILSITRLIIHHIPVDMKIQNIILVK